MVTKKTRIVIVEDDPSILKLYELKLTLEGYEVGTARNGAEGLTVVQAFEPVLILLDIRMPIMNGEEMLRTLRNEKWGEDVKVIILTNISKDEAPIGLRFLNVDRYIVKVHHTPQQVVDIVKEVLA